jgi:hypothetical protein
MQKLPSPGVESSPQSTPSALSTFHIGTWSRADKIDCVHHYTNLAELMKLEEFATRRIYMHVFEATFEHLI